MIKRYNQFVNESKEVPGPGTHGSVRISLSDEEVDMFASEPSLEKLISNNKVALLAPELWYMEDDMETINVLKNYFEVNTDSEDYEEEEPGFDEENESVTNETESYKEKMKRLVSSAKEKANNKGKKVEVKEITATPGSYKEKMMKKVARAKEVLGGKKKVNEEFEVNEGENFSHTSLICPHCEFEQNESPENILQDNGNFSEDESGTIEFGNYECEECNKPFEFVKQVEVRYYCRK